MILISAGERFYPSGCGGHKNSGNVATFTEFLGGRKNLSPAPKCALALSYLNGHLVGGKTSPSRINNYEEFSGRKNLAPAYKLVLAGTFTFTANKSAVTC